MTVDSGTAAREIDLHAARAWPASVVEEAGGWLLRHTPGLARNRTNSALPLTDGVPDPGPMEEFYRAHGVSPRVQVSPRERSPELDALLAARGYERRTETIVLHAAAEDVVAATADAAAKVEVEVATEPGPWPGVFAELDGRPDSGLVAERVVSRLALPAAYLSARDADRTAGIGLVVAESAWAGIFCMNTHPDFRRRGVASAVLGAAARWAAGQGAERLYLQVVRSNDAARRLYERAGFTYSHGYHYRVRP